MANILCFYPNGALEQGFSQLEIQIAGGPPKGPGDHSPVLRLGIQSSMTGDNMDKSRSKKFGNQCCSLKPCLFWGENRLALVCRASQMNCNFVHQFIGRGNPPFFSFHPPTCSSSSLEVFTLAVSQASNYFNVWLCTERSETLVKHRGWGIHDCHNFFSLWLSCRLFQQDKWTTFNSQQFLNEKAVRNQNKYFHIWLQRLKKEVLYWSPESVLRRHLKGILSAAEQYLLMKLF